MVWAHHVRAVLPCRADPSHANARCRDRFDEGLYREYNVIERFVGHLKAPRAIGTSCDKLVVNCKAMMQVARRGSCLRHLHSSGRT